MHLIIKCLWQHIALNDLRDTGAVASATAAKIYNLNILAENIQVCFCLIIVYLHKKFKP